MPNVMAALRNIGGANEERKFRNSLPCPTPKVWLTPTARVQCSNAANIIRERKTWTQSEFCTWQNSVRGQEPTKMYVYSLPAQNRAKYRAKFG